MKKELLFISCSGCRPAKGLLPLAILLFWLFQTATYAQTMWTGATSNDWATATNWSTAAVPGPSDDVVIPNVPTSPVLSTTTVVKSVVVRASASLAISATGSLSIQGSAGNGLVTSGTLTNAGHLKIGGIKAVAGRGIVCNGNSITHNINGATILIDSTDNRAMVIFGLFNNASLLKIGSLARTVSNGIEIGSGGTFNNNPGGLITIDRLSGVAGGIVNGGTFTNQAQIIVGGFSLNSQDGLFNNGMFTNAATGEIRVDRSYSHGVWTIGGTFQNSGKIFIGSVATAGTSGIYATGPFNNTSGAEIHIDRVRDGIVITSAFTNASLIRIGATVPTTRFGILNSGSNAVFTNDAGGNISIEQPGQFGIATETGATFTNHALVRIGTAGNTAGEGINNAGTLANNACATLSVFDNIANSGSFSNAGLFTVQTTQAHTNTGTLTNDGIIEYPLGNPIPNVINNDLVVAPVAGCHPSVSPALQVGGANSFTAATTWYQDANLTMAAGTYDDAQNKFTATNLAPGSTTTLYFAATDNINNCVRTVSIAVTLNAPPSFTATTTPVSCNGGFDGSISITPSSGTGPYTYSKGSGANYGTELTFTGLAAGTYSIRVKDDNGCESDIQQIAVTEPASRPTFTATPTPVSCNGGFDGTISVSASGGTGPYTFSKGSGASYGTESTFTGLAAGTYSIRVKDDNGCESDIQQIAVTEPASRPTFTATPTPVSCNGGFDGTISVSASGGTGPYTFSKGSGASYGTESTFTGLAAGTYSIRVKDDNGCESDIQQIAVTEPASRPTFTATPTPVSCNGGFDGTISVSASGGTGPYTFSKGSGASYGTESTFTGLAAGTYSIRVKDDNGCESDIQQIAVTEPASRPTFTATPTPVSCNGGFDGTISVSASGGTGPYTFSKGSGASYGTESTFTGLAAGTYSIRVKDDNGCESDIQQIAVTEPASRPTFTATPTPVSCNGGFDGTISVSASGGTGPYTFSKGSGASYGTESTFTGLAAGTYSIRVKDDNGCESDIQQITLSEPATLTASTVSPTNVACHGGSTGSIAVAANGGTPEYSYTLSPGNVTISSGNFEGLAAGTYSVQVTDLNRCQANTGPILISQPPVLSLGVSGNTSVTYGYGSNCTILTASASGGTGTISLSWSNGANGTSTQVCPTKTTTYSVKATDQNSCSVNKEITVTVNDVRCGPDGQNVTICYYGSTQCVNEKTAERYLKLGATLGPCNSANARTGYEPMGHGPELTLSLRAYPNPTPDQVTVQVSIPMTGEAQFQVMDVGGRAVRTRTEQLTQSLNEVTFQLGTLPAGTYLIRCVDALGRQAVVRISRQ